MSANLSVITDKLVKEFMPLAEKMQIEGKPQTEIDRAFKNYLESKARKPHKPLFVKTLKDTIGELMKLADQETSGISIERVLYDALQEAGISFVFHKQIGPYTPNFVIDFLIVEIEEEQQNKRTDQDAKREEYLKKRGYYIMKIPAFIVETTPRAAVQAIEEELVDILQNI